MASAFRGRKHTFEPFLLLLIGSSLSIILTRPSAAHLLGLNAEVAFQILGLPAVGVKVFWQKFANLKGSGEGIFGEPVWPPSY